MNYPVWTILVAVLLPYIWATIGMLFKIKMDGKIDLKSPRDQAARLEGIGKRANAAQSNSWEALGVYTACFLTAVTCGVEPEQIMLPAMIWVAFRVMHGLAYLADIGILRMFSFTGGMACSIMIIFRAF